MMALRTRSEKPPREPQRTQFKQWVQAWVMSDVGSPYTHVVTIYRPMQKTKVLVTTFEPRKSPPMWTDDADKKTTETVIELWKMFDQENGVAKK